MESWNKHKNATKPEIFRKTCCLFQFFPIFALAKTGEIDLARESAFFALFLDCELAHSQL